MTADLAILYEHPGWCQPLFAALEERGVSFNAIDANRHFFDPADREPPAPLIFNRIAMSAFDREPQHPIYYARALLRRWASDGAEIINGPRALEIDSSKADQLALVARLGLRAPRTRVIHRREEAAAAAAEIGFPLLIKGNIGGAGRGIRRFDDAGALDEALTAGEDMLGVDRVALVQEYIAPKEGKITRVETLERRFLYAIDVPSSGEAFDLCPADLCLTDKPDAPQIRAADPPDEAIRAAEAIAEAVEIDVGGIECLTDPRDGGIVVYDVNALSNFVADAPRIVGFDPHARLADYLAARIERGKARAA